MGAINGRVQLFAGTYPAGRDAVRPEPRSTTASLVVTGSHDFTPHHFTTALKLIQHGIVRSRR